MRGVDAKLDEARVTESVRSGDGAGGSKLLRGVCLLVTDIDAPSGGVQKNSRLLLKKLSGMLIQVRSWARINKQYGCFLRCKFRRMLDEIVYLLLAIRTLIAWKAAQYNKDDRRS